NVVPDTWPPEIDRKVLWQDPARIAFKHRVLVGDEPPVELFGHQSIGSLEGEKAAVDKVILACPKEGRRARRCSGDRRLGEKAAAKAVDAKVRVALVGTNGVAVDHLAENIAQRHQGPFVPHGDAPSLVVVPRASKARQVRSSSAARVSSSGSIDPQSGCNP